MDQANLKASGDNKTIEVYNPDNTAEDVPVYLLNASPIHYNSIARVCETDAFSIE